MFIQIGFQIKTRVQELGHGCIFLVQKAGALQITPSDGFTKRELIDCARAVTEKVLFEQTFSVTTLLFVVFDRGRILSVTDLNELSDLDD